MSRVWKYARVDRRHLRIRLLGLENAGDIGRNGEETLRSRLLHVVGLVLGEGLSL